MNPPKKELTHVLDWVNKELKGETAPPWEWYQLMKLREVVGAILIGVDPLTPREADSSPRINILQLVDSPDKI